MSGGVDSSVAAYLLRSAGYEVIGLTLLIWQGEGRLCCGDRALFDAQACASQIGIPHYPIDLRKEFYEKVVHDFLKNYLLGMTPNPCVECNRSIKFGLIREKLKSIFADKDAYIATGHYARIEDLRLKRAKSRKDDQSYFLYSIPRENLSSILFPLGDYTKEEVREIARKNGLITAEKEKSQEICFIPDKSYAQFILKIAPDSAQPGPILDKEGREIGRHKGIIFYTLGQRKRIGLAKGKRLYVIKIDPPNNTLIVGEEEDAKSDELFFLPTNLFFPIPDGTRLKAKVRHMDKESWAMLKILEGGRLHLKFEEKKWAITPGQSVVLYDNDTVLGGGIILPSP